MKVQDMAQNLYSDTRGQSERPVTFTEAVIDGLAAGGGLYVPERIPELSLDEIGALAELPYAQRAARIYRAFDVDLPAETVEALMAQAYGDNFDDERICPITSLSADTHVLELLGVEPEIGARFTISFDVDGHTTTQTFTLCGWWEYDEAIVANHILIPESRADAILDEAGTVPPGEDGMTGSWNLDVMLKSGSRHIANDIAQILESHGYQDQSAGAPDYIHTGVNWGYTGAQLSDNLDPSVVIAVAAMLLLIIFTGYLIIYNVFQISVTNDIRFYGLLKTIGTTPRQLRRASPWGWCWVG